MSDLISREALLGILRKRGRELIKMNLIVSERTVAINTVYECIGIAKDAPAVDAAEVVRCKDCAFYIPWGNEGKICGRVGAYYGDTKPDDFCSRSVRMD